MTGFIIDNVVANAVDRGLEQLQAITLLRQNTVAETKRRFSV